MKKILSVIGTRPEAIKMAPIITRARKNADLKMIVCSTGQHKTMLNQTLDLFDIKPDFSLNVMRENQTLSWVTANLITKLDSVIRKEMPDIILVQGDTATVFAASLVGFYNNIKIAHVEAGLRTSDIKTPFPEEMCRRFCDMVSSIYFAPTENNKKNLLKEGIKENEIFVTGNTVIDALYHIIKYQERRNNKDVISALLKAGYSNAEKIAKRKNVVLITGHRRENFGTGVRSVCSAIKKLAQQFVDYDFVYPVHLNPNVKKPVCDLLNDLNNVYLLPPLEYPELIYVLSQSRCVITDSGGIQEEAPSLKKNLIVTRETTERTELINMPGFQLVGCNEQKIFNACKRWLSMGEKEYFNATQKITNPFGDGNAARKIVDILLSSR